MKDGFWSIFLWRLTSPFNFILLFILFIFNFKPFSLPVFLLLAYQPLVKWDNVRENISFLRVQCNKIYILNCIPSHAFCAWFYAYFRIWWVHTILKKASTRCAMIALEAIFLQSYFWLVFEIHDLQSFLLEVYHCINILSPNNTSVT